MSFSYTEKKRVRRSFEKISSVMDLPNLLATQLESYESFLQRDIDPQKRNNQGLELSLNSIIPSAKFFSQSSCACSSAPSVIYLNEINGTL